MLPVISRKPFSKSNGYVILAAPGSKEKLADSKILAEALAAGKGVLIVDLWGTGETNKTDNEDLMYHDLTRAVLWLGKTMMGEWCRDFALLASHLRMSCPGSQMEVGGLGAAGLAALLFSAMDGNAVPVILERSTVSLVFHREAPSDYSTMVYYIPGFLGFGDLSLAAALTGGVVRFIAALSQSGYQAPP